jgi:hypothetical protein
MSSGGGSNVKQLIAEVAKLSPEELAEFELEWEALRLKQIQGLERDEEAASIVAHYRLPPKQQQKVKELLQANQEGQLTRSEEEELDALLEEIDRRNIAAAQALMELAKKRRVRSTP